MKQVCARCGIMYGEKEPHNDQRITHGFCKECLTELVVETTIEESLKISIYRENNRVKISLIFKGKEISSDFIDYDEVVRVIHKENEETKH
jgi:hypothetical protein